MLHLSLLLVVMSAASPSRSLKPFPADLDSRHEPFDLEGPCVRLSFELQNRPVPHPEFQGFGFGEILGIGWLRPGYDLDHLDPICDALRLTRCWANGPCPFDRFSFPEPSADILVTYSLNNRLRYPLAAVFLEAAAAFDLDDPYRRLRRDAQDRLAECRVDEELAMVLNRAATIWDHLQELVPTATAPCSLLSLVLATARDLDPAASSEEACPDDVYRYLAWRVGGDHPVFRAACIVVATGGYLQ